MEAVILKTVSIGTIDYTGGIMKSKVENFYNIFDNYETRSHSPFMGNGSSHGDGFIHSFGKKSGWNLIENTKSIKSINAIIPFGSLYYYDAKNDEYCSTKLKLIWNEK